MLHLEKFRGLGIQGGGMAGISYLGSLKRWIKEGLTMEQFDYFAGSSAGSLVAAMLAIRAPVDYIEKKLRSTDFSKFIDTSFISMVEDLFTFFRKYGWNSGTELETWFADAVGELTGNRNMTFAQAHERYGTHLMITKTDVLYPECQLVVMDYKSHPNTTLHEAVRESSSIPEFFQAVFGSGAEKGHVFVDGGVLLNYPLKLLYTMLPKEQCMGLYLTSPKSKGIVSRPVKSHKEFISSITTSWKNAMMGQHVSTDDWFRTCAIAVEISPIEFKANKEKQDEAVKQGWAGMDTFISNIKSLSAPKELKLV